MKQKTSVKDKTNIYLISIVAIVAVVGIVVLILNSSAGSVSLSSDDLSGQAILQPTAKATFGDDLVKISDLSTCACSYDGNYWSVSIECAGDNWRNTANFDIFDQVTYETDWVGLGSSQNVDTENVRCYYRNDFVSETKKMQCDGDSYRDDEVCNKFCESQLSTTEIAMIENNLNTCVTYFTAQCNGEVTTESKYGNGEWGIIGYCGMYD